MRPEHVETQPNLARARGLQSRPQASGVPARGQPDPDLLAVGRSRWCSTIVMPASRKAMLAGAAGYLLVGRDLIPDYVPVLGGLDDLVVVVLAVDLFLDGIPDDLLEEKLDDLGIDRAVVRSRHGPGASLDAGSGPTDHPPGSRPDRRGRGGHESTRSRAPDAGLDHQGGTQRVKVILTKDVPKLGKSGEMRMVADGFATNFLIPQQLAVPAAGGAYRAWQHDIASREDKRVRERGEAEIAATRIASARP